MRRDRAFEPEPRIMGPGSPQQPGLVPDCAAPCRHLIDLNVQRRFPVAVRPESNRYHSRDACLESAPQ
jgi:hypothetical protein